MLWFGRYASSHSFMSYTIWLDSFQPPAGQSMRLSITFTSVTKFSIHHFKSWLTPKLVPKCPLRPLEWPNLPVLVNEEHTLFNEVHLSVTRMKQRWLPYSAWWNIPRMGGTVHYSPRYDQMYFDKDWVMYLVHFINIVHTKMWYINCGFIAESLGPLVRGSLCIM